MRRGRLHANNSGALRIVDAACDSTCRVSRTGIAEPRDDERISDELAHKLGLKLLTDLTQHTQVAQCRVSLPGSDVDRRPVTEDASYFVSYSTRLDSRLGLEVLTYDLGDDANKGECREERSEVEDAAV